ncbi:hypothetical protein [Agromyces bauzanensis]
MADDPERPGAEQWVPTDADVAELRRAAHECRGCELWRDATQVVFSAGRAGAKLMLVGEQPGDREDLEGESPSSARPGACSPTPSMRRASRATRCT